MRLRDYLHHHGESITAFAGRIGRNVTTVHGWVQGRRLPDAIAVATIEKATAGEVRASDFLPISTPVAAA